MKLNIFTSAFCGIALRRNAFPKLQRMSISTIKLKASMESSVVESETLRWLKEHVIQLNLCPFAKASLMKGTVDIVVSETSDAKTLRNQVVDAALALEQSGNMTGSGTVLIAAPYVKRIEDFHEYLYFSEEISNDMNWVGLFGKIQLASFHPNYQFEGTEKDDITNYTNRCPWPLFHLLREVEVSKAVDSYKGETDIIWQNNQETMKSQGKEKLSKFFESFTKKEV
mmetsp:Transcript_10371/g.12584  ORF Transcript_10371/g.12584 Transcript_10371/m.12584 type:complete len:226 (+) Transcript_10371:106-783(+)